MGASTQLPAEPGDGSPCHRAKLWATVAFARCLRQTCTVRKLTGLKTLLVTTGAATVRNTKLNILDVCSHTALQRCRTQCAV